MSSEVTLLKRTYFVFDVPHNGRSQDVAHLVYM